MSIIAGGLGGAVSLSRIDRKPELTSPPLDTGRAKRNPAVANDTTNDTLLRTDEVPGRLPPALEG